MQSQSSPTNRTAVPITVAGSEAVIAADDGAVPTDGRTLREVAREVLLEVRLKEEWEREVLWPSVLAAAIVGGLLVFLAMKRLSVPLWLAAFLTALRRRAWMLCRVVGAGLLVVGMLGVYAASRADEGFEWWAVAAGVGAGMVATTLPMRATN
ncbi:MAG: hypothetical protein ACK5Q4_14415 [Phycisphaerae bacterium]